MSLVGVLLQRVPNLKTKSVYELSSRGPLLDFLKTHMATVTFSEYFDDVPPGGSKGGIQCQDVQNLTFDDCSFDICTSTDVFEHVPDDNRGFSETYRVLRPGGCAIFTVPLHETPKTTERVEIVDGHIKHILPPEYHDDHIRGLGQVLAFRNYGVDILDRLLASQFSSAEIVRPDASLWWGHGRSVVVAYRLAPA